MHKYILTSLFIVIACDKPRKVEAFGEPFAVSVDGSGVVPPFELAMMLSKGASPAPLVQPATSLLVQALKKCASIDDKKEHKVTAEIAVSTQARATVRAGTPTHPFEACLAEAMKASTVEWPSPPEAATMRVELRLSNRSGT